MANTGTNTVIQALAKSGITAHRKIEALQKQNAELAAKSNELANNMNQLTSGLQKLATFTRELMERVVVLEGEQEEQAEDVASFADLMAAACQTVLHERVGSSGGDGAEIDPLPPAYTPLSPLANHVHSAERPSSAPSTTD
jgi:X-X-X-Leu-X-X-Gly heptad repeat protein